MLKQGVTTKQHSSGWRGRRAQLRPAMRAGMRSCGRTPAYVRPYRLPLAAAGASLVLSGASATGN